MTNSYDGSYCFTYFAYEKTGSERLGKVGQSQAAQEG